MSVAADTYYPGVFIAGSEIPNADADHPPHEQAISWIRQADSSVAAQLYSYESLAGAAESLFLQAIAKIPGSAAAYLHATQDPNPTNNEAYVQALVNATAVTSAVNAGATGKVATILNSAGDSSFLRGRNLFGGVFNPTLGGPGPYTAWTINLQQTTAPNALLLWIGSAFAPAFGNAQYCINVDGVTKATTTFFFNAANVHQLLSPLIVPLPNLATGVHTFQVFPQINLTPDANDTGAWLFIG